MSNRLIDFWYAGQLSGDAEFKPNPLVMRRIQTLPYDALRQLAIAMAGKARQNAPRKSGELAEGIKAFEVNKKYPYKAYWKVGTFTRSRTAYATVHKGKEVFRSKTSGRRVSGIARRGYGAPVEYGHFMRTRSGRPTRYVTERPFLRPARVWMADHIDMILTSAGIPLK